VWTSKIKYKNLQEQAKLLADYVSNSARPRKTNLKFTAHFPLLSNNIDKKPERQKEREERRKESRRKSWESGCLKFREHRFTTFQLAKKSKRKTEGKMQEHKFSTGEGRSAESPGGDRKRREREKLGKM